MEENVSMIDDEENGMRWENGTYERTLRRKNRGKLKEKFTTNDISARLIVDSDELMKQMITFFRLSDRMFELAIANTVLIDSLSEEGKFAYYSEAIGKVMDIDLGDVPDERFSYFLYRMRCSYLRFSMIWLNTMVLPGVYAEFIGRAESTVRGWIKSGRIDVIVMGGIQFVVVSQDEFMAFNKFLIARAVAEGKPNLQIYERIISEKIEVIDTIAGWLQRERIVPINEGRHEVFRVYSDEAYSLYTRYCRGRNGAVATKTAFLRRLSADGFYKFNTKRRGFLFYREILQGKWEGLGVNIREN